jgi:O-antigen/teichoic acid export membrane protein
VNELSGARRSAVLSAAFRGALAACSMLLLLVVVRILGEREAGRFYIAFGLTTLGASLGQAGMNHLLSRRVAASPDARSVRQAWRTGLHRALKGSLLVALVLLLGAPLLGTLFDDPALVVPLRLLALAVVPLTVLLVVAETWKGLDRPLLSMTAQVGVVPLVAIPPVWMLSAHGAAGAAAAYSMAALLTAILALAAVHRSLPALGSAPASVLGEPGIAGSASATFLYGVLTLVHARAAPLLLGALRGSEAVVLLEVATRVLTVPTLLLAGINTMLAPRLARLHQAGRPEALVAQCRSVSRVALVLIAPLLVLTCALHAPIAHLFGLSGAPLAPLFLCLAVGEAVNLATGPATLVLLMSGHERAVRNLSLLATATSIAVGAWAIGLWGATGAAIGYSTGIAGINLGTVLVARRALGVWTSPFAPAIPLPVHEPEEPARAA